MKSYLKKKLIEFLKKILSIKKLEDDIASLEQKLTPRKIQEIKDPSLKTSPDGRFSIRVQKIEKDCVNIYTSLPMITNGKINVLKYSYEFPRKVDSTLGDPCPEMFLEFLDAIFETKICVKVSFTVFEVSIIKTPAVGWDNILPKFEEIIFEFLNKKYPVDETK